MKCLFCVECQDVIKAIRKERFCSCGKSSICAPDGHVVVITGQALVFGIDNYELSDAVTRWLAGVDRAGFSAFFFIPQLGESSYHPGGRQQQIDAMKADAGIKAHILRDGRFAITYLDPPTENNLLGIFTVDAKNGVSNGG